MVSRVRLPDIPIWKQVMTEVKTGPFLVISKLTSSYGPSIRIGVWKKDYETEKDAQDAINNSSLRMMHMSYYIGVKSELEEDIKTLAPNEKHRTVFYQDPH